LSGERIHSQLSDEELLIRYRQSGDNHWLGLLLQRYTMLLLGVAMKYLKSRESAEDAVQQIFIKALTQLPQGEILNFKGWLYILMRNYCLQQLRDQTYTGPEEILHQLPASEDRTEELRIKDRNLEEMNTALGLLHADQRKALELFYLQKQSYQQIQDQTGWTFMQVKSFIQNGKRNLKLILARKIGNKEI